MTMKPIRLTLRLLATCAAGMLGLASAHAQESWAGQTFLTDYSKLQPMPSTKGRDYLYFAPGADGRGTRISKIILDQPEIFLSPDSPYAGAKPADLAAIADALRSTAAAALQERGYTIVDQPAADALYVRLALTDLKLAKKKRNLLTYTPVGFVVSAGVKALQDFMDKFDILDMALQIEVQDSVKQDVLGAAVIRRGQSADATKSIEFEALVAVMNEYAERFACRLDNAHVGAAKAIDCHDPVARKARPQLVGK
jgi:hypothetical protein